MIKYRILCITTGKYIKTTLNRPYQNGEIYYKVAGRDDLYRYRLYSEVLTGDQVNTICPESIGGIENELNELHFSSREMADWFIRRRLTYNSKRTHHSKLSFMESIFESSGIQDFKTIKQEFEIEEFEE